MCLDVLGPETYLRYREAAEAYLDLTIGKAGQACPHHLLGGQAAWPVGIGCGGSMLMEASRPKLEVIH